MPANRGPHPEDATQFDASQWPRLRAAVRDLSWLRSRGYSGSAPKKLVGDRYRLKRRQRDAVARSACSDAERAHRLDSQLPPRAVAGCDVAIDVFNVLITIEAALGGAYVFVGRDTAFRDVNPVKGTYRIVQQTGPALELLADSLQSLDVEGVVWHLDQSVSNVGRVKANLQDEAARSGGSWKIAEHDAVDEALCATSNPVATSDSEILDASESWFHLEAVLHRRSVSDANLVDLRPDGERSTLPGAVVDR